MGKYKATFRLSITNQGLCLHGMSDIDHYFESEDNLDNKFKDIIIDKFDKLLYDYSEYAWFDYEIIILKIEKIND